MRRDDAWFVSRRRFPRHHRGRERLLHRAAGWDYTTGLGTLWVSELAADLKK